MRKNLTARLFVLLQMLLITLKPFSQNVLTVTDCNLNGWVKDQRGTSRVSFVNGPATPPLGTGSFHCFCPDAHGPVGRIRNGQYSGIQLSSITELSFSTFIEQRSSMENPYSDAPFVVLQVDANGDNIAEFHLVFDPASQSQPYVANNFPDQGKTLVGVWQNWDMYHGGWFDGPDDPQHGFPLFSLATFIAQHPNARILNDVTQGGASIRLSAGGPVSSGNFIGDIDNFRIGVNGATTIYDFEYTTANAGADKNVVYGYGSNCTTLTGSAAGGVAPYSYSWSPGGSLANNSTTEVCPTTATTYTLTVTDKNGCIRSDDVTVFVNDVRCGSKMDKVKVCHNGQEICVAKEAVATHLDHGDVLGSCPQEMVTRNSNRVKNERTEHLQFRLANYPNPFSGITRIEYELPTDGNVSLKIYDLTGKEITTLVNSIKKQGKYSVDFSSARVSTGVYYYKISVCSGAKVFTQTNKMIIAH